MLAVIDDVGASLIYLYSGQRAIFIHRKVDNPQNYCLAIAFLLKKCRKAWISSSDEQTGNACHRAIKEWELWVIGIGA